MLFTKSISNPFWRSYRKKSIFFIFHFLKFLPLWLSTIENHCRFIEFDGWKSIAVPLAPMVAFQPLKKLDPLHWLTTIENHQVQCLSLQNHWQFHCPKILPSIRSTSLKSPICTRKRSGCTAAFVHSGKTQVTLESNRSTTSYRNPGSWRPKKCFRAEWGTGGAPINSFI